MKTLMTVTLAALVTATTASAALHQIDRDDSGTISATEFLHVYSADAGIEQFRAIDTNNDQEIDLVEYQASTHNGFFADN